MAQHESAVPCLHVVVSCKRRKTLPVPAETSISFIHAADLEQRANEWISALEKAQLDERPAGDLYAGDHWKVVLEMPASAKELQVKLWVASAGYGLIEIGTLLKPYFCDLYPVASRVCCAAGCCLHQ